MYSTATQRTGKSDWRLETELFGQCVWGKLQQTPATLLRHKVSKVLDECKQQVMDLASSYTKLQSYRMGSLTLLHRGEL